MNKSFFLLLIKQILFSLLMSLTLISCEKDDPGLIDIEESSLVGEWLLSTSDKEKQTVFQIKENPFDLWVEIRKNNSKILGFGNRFSVSRGVISGKYATQDNELVEFSWKVKEELPLEIVVEETSEKGTVPISLHSLKGELDLECTTINNPDYARLTGVRGFKYFCILDSSVATIDSATGELMIGDTPGYTYILVTTTSGTCAIALQTHEGRQPVYENIWVCDLPSEERWIRVILPGEQGGKGKVHRSVYGKSCVMYESLTGNFNQEGDNISLTLTGPTLTQPEHHTMKLMSRSDSEISVMEADKDPMVFQRILKSSLIAPGDIYLPNYHKITAGDKIKNFKSHDETIATVSSTGEITGVAEGITFVDMVTDSGVYVFEVEVDGGIIPYPFEEMFSIDGRYVNNPLCQILGYIGKVNEATNSSSMFYNAHPLFKQLVLVRPVYDSLKRVDLYYIDSINREDLIRALGERYTLSDPENFIYINSKELSDATVIIKYYKSSFLGSGPYVSFAPIKQ